MTENSIWVHIQIFSWFSGVLVPGLNSALLLEEELPANCSLRTCFNRLAERYPKFAEVIYDPNEDELQVSGHHTQRAVADRIGSPRFGATKWGLDCPDTILCGWLINIQSKKKE